MRLYYRLKHTQTSLLALIPRLHTNLHLHNFKKYLFSITDVGCVLSKFTAQACTCMPTPLLFSVSACATLSNTHRHLFFPNTHLHTHIFSCPEPAVLEGFSPLCGNSWLGSHSHTLCILDGPHTHIHNNISNGPLYAINETCVLPCSLNRIPFWPTQC